MFLAVGFGHINRQIWNPLGQHAEKKFEVQNGKWGNNWKTVNRHCLNNCKTIKNITQDKKKKRLQMLQDGIHILTLKKVIIYILTEQFVMVYLLKEFNNTPISMIIF